MITQTLSTEKRWLRMLLMLPAILLIIGNAQGQTTGFTYQGRLTDVGNPATNIYDFQFKLFDTADIGTGAQQGPTINLTSVQVENGVFTVELDFGAGVFDGSARFLQIGLRPAGSPGAFTVLSPRQPVTTTPYAVRSATAGTADTATNATQLSGLTASSFIQNTTSQQSATNFNIGGTGTASILNATTQFNLDGFRILKRGSNSIYAGVTAGGDSTGSSNSFFGDFAGPNNSTGGFNSFFGAGAGLSNTTGSNNSFFGRSAGANNTTGGFNSSFGYLAGANNTTGSNNSFVGFQAGLSNTVGNNNTIIGTSANVGANDLNFATAIGAGTVVNSSNTVVLGRGADTVQIPGTLNATGPFNASIVNATTQFNIGGNRVLSSAGTNNLFVGLSAGAMNTGSNNAFFGPGAGAGNTTGFSNTFFGSVAGFGNTTGENNTFLGLAAGAGNVSGQGLTAIGAGAGFNSCCYTNATAIGYRATVTQSNSLVLGGILGVNLSPANTNVGIGTTAPGARLHINGSEEGIRIQGPSSGNANAAYLTFADGPGTQIGYVGDGSSTDQNMYLTSYIADVIIYTPHGAALTATSAGNVLMSGGPNVLGPSVNTYAAQTIDTGSFKALFTPNLFLSSLDTFLASPVHVCARVQTIGGSGGYALTRCTTSLSSVMNKTDLQPFAGGLEIIRRLNPVSFKWKAGGGDDVGLNAEEVAEVEPQLVTRNEKGEVEDVKQENMMVVFINAFKQQQAQIKSLQQEIETLKKRQQDLDALKATVCADRPNSSICKSN